MIPLRDNVPSERVPVVNYALIGVTALVFILQVTGSTETRAEVVYRFGMVPVRVLHPDAQIIVPQQTGHRLERVVLPPSPLPEWLTLISCIFLHGGWLHFLGNMWVLYIFGDNVEDRLGRLGYLAFYMGCGVIASASHLASNPSSPMPTVGASGAIAGVMGAYLLLYPRARVLTLVPIFFFLQILVLPAPIFLGFWFFLQFFQGTLAISTATGGGVAWWAHIGGFVAGAVTVLSLRRANWLRRPPSLTPPQVLRYRLRFPRR